MPIDRRIFFVVAVILVSVVILGVWYVRNRVRLVFYPLPTQMPKVVDQSMEELLQQYEQHMALLSPKSLQALQPGLTAEEVASLEQKYNCVLTDDLRALYRWRNGTKSHEHEFVPIRQFIPLEQALNARKAQNDQLRSASLGWRIADAVFVGHRHSWVGIVVDAAGDGYFYDPDRRTHSGSFFFNFLEDGAYVYFPSVNNFLAYVNECFEQGIYRIGNDGRFEEDFVRSMNLRTKYAGSNYQF